VLCRHADESAADFQTRVVDRIERIRTCRRIRALWYVAGSESVPNAAAAGVSKSGRCALPLLDTLLPMLETGASLTVVGPGTHQGEVFAWLDSLIPQQRSRVTVRAQLYPLHAVAAPQPRRAPPRSSPVSVVAARSHDSEAEEALAESA
jgi:hypothetical protein